MKRVVLKSNVVYAESSEREKCSKLDEMFFGTLTEREQATYRISYEPKGNQTYQLVATYESEAEKVKEEYENKINEIREEHAQTVKNLSDIINYLKNENEALTMESHRIKGKGATSGVTTGFKNKRNSLKGKVEGALTGGTGKGKGATSGVTTSFKNRGDNLQGKVGGALTGGTGKGK